ncbi:MAG: MBL fold metallo-hydrolase [Verrucomicrobiales bacterium]
MTHPVRIKFWGTRGSIARPGPQTLRYGGNTSCVEVVSSRGTRVVIDSGTGAYDLGRALAAERPAPTRGHLLISHTHWDHIQGFPFFAPLFRAGGKWHIYGPTGLGRSLRDGLAGQMEHTYFPVTLEEMGANIQFHDLVEGRIEIEDIRVDARYLNHTALTLGYRLEMEGVVVVYACDHEPYARAPGTGGAVHDLDRRHAAFLAEADLVIHDAQFTDAEYASRVGWGHSPVEYVCEMACMGGVKRLALTHHDPSRTDEELDVIAGRARETMKRDGWSLEVFAAAEGEEITLEPKPGAEPGSVPAESVGGAPEAATVARAMMDPLVLIGVADDGLARILEAAASEVGVRSVRARDGETAFRLARQYHPPLIVLENRAAAEMDGLDICRRLRGDREQALASAAVVMVSDREKPDEGQAAGVTRWLLVPFSRHYAKAQLQAWLLRTKSRWARAVLPSDEEARLAALADLAILDTDPEERFDRLTRLAVALADVPIALVSLVDRDRQWFKSCHGLGESETPREVSFCAHVVATRASLVVPDTLLDERFADNPLVVGATRVRFYAGFPVFHANGSCLGTLCLLDTRPRLLPGETIQGLEDLALLVQKELNAEWPRTPVGTI